MDRESGNCNQQIMDEQRDAAAFIQSVVVATGGSANPGVMNFQQPHRISIDPTTLSQPNSRFKIIIQPLNVQAWFNCCGRITF